MRKKKTILSFVAIMKEVKIANNILLAFLFVFIFVIASCNDKNVNTDETKRQIEEVTNSLSIPFTEYLLEGTSCQWNYHSGAKQVIVINSKEELENYIDCSDGSYPEIDFSKNTLLLARSRAINGIHHIDIDFLQEAANEYTLNTAVYMLNTEEATAWTIGIIVPKMDNETKITFNETYTNYTGEKEENLLAGTTWKCVLEYSQEVTFILYFDKENIMYTTTYPKDLNLTGLRYMFNDGGKCKYLVHKDTLHLGHPDSNIVCDAGIPYTINFIQTMISKDTMQLDYNEILPTDYITRYLFIRQTN